MEVLIEENLALLNKIKEDDVYNGIQLPWFESRIAHHKIYMFTIFTLLSAISEEVFPGSYHTVRLMAFDAFYIDSESVNTNEVERWMQNECLRILGGNKLIDEVVDQMNAIKEGWRQLR